ncbi:carboxypeptidase-like regulatory domain-containing protein [Zobellia nedashkovskayae]
MEIKFTESLFYFRKTLLINIMRTFIFLFCVTMFSFTPNNVLSQNAKIKIDIDKEVTIDEVFDLITQQTEYAFMYQDNLFKDFPKVQLEKGVILMDKLINQSLSNGNLSAILTINNTILIKEAKPIQQHQVSGKIMDDNGFPIPGVTILIKGTNTAAISDYDGIYVLNVSNPENVLVFSSLGFETQEIIVGIKSIINVTLKEKISELNEVILVGYGTTRKQDLTGSVGSLKSEGITQVKSQTVELIFDR